MKARPPSTPGASPRRRADLSRRTFLAAGLVDRLVWFRAPLILGARGRPAVGDLPWDRLADAPRFRRAALAEFGPDLCETYERT